MSDIEKGKKNKKTAVETAYAFLAVRMRTTEEVRKHLESKEYDEKEILDTINELIGMRYLDDYQFALRYYEYNHEKKRGALRAERELIEKGIDRDTVRNAKEDFLYEQKINEFEDALDGRKKYCQCKAGPQTINKDDVATILGHFKHLNNKARLDRLSIQIDDMIVGVLYGEEDDLSGHYKIINSHYPVYCGAEFWEHLTGDKQFYHRLAKAFGEVVEEDGIDARIHLSEKITELANEIREKGGL